MANTQAKWYVARSGDSDKWSGPYAEDQVVQFLQSGEVSWADGIWNVTFGPSWKRILEISAFQAHFPALPSGDLIQKIMASPQKPATEFSGPTVELEGTRALWYVQFDGSEFGPMTMSEVAAILKRGKLTGQLLGWRSGFAKWLPIAEIPEFRAFFAAPGAEPPFDLRRADRKAFVATIRFAEKTVEKAPEVHTGVARDISATGMRITTNNVPKAIGTQLIMSVEPVSIDSIPKFSVEAEVMRIVGDRIFAVRFSKVDPAIQKLILNFTG